MTDMRDGHALNRSVAEHVAEVRDSLERGRVEIERQKQALHDLSDHDEDAAA
ncbi:MAG TPA: hypothetical protein VGU02_03385 [Gaiellaceae bacterium]|nr:hypothetical protein [Gaiellaceae bacterium]